MAASSSSVVATSRLVLPSRPTPSNRGRVGTCSPDAPGRSIIHFPSSSCCPAERWRRNRGNLTAAIGRGSAGTAVASLAGRNAKKRETLVPEPDYRIAVVLLGFAGFLTYQDNLLAAAPIGLLGLLLLFQTTRVRFVFDEEALEVKLGDTLQESGENVFVGGKNRWKYSSFVNWELWWPNFPILVYFKETQTKPDGQVHFFPVIFNGKQLYDAMVERAGPSTTSGPKET